LRAAGILLVLLLGLTGTAPAAATGSASQRFTAAGRVEAPSIMVTGHGPINGIGTLTAESVEFHQADDSYRETDLAVVGQGQFTLSVRGRFSVWPFTLDALTCTRHGTLGGTWTLAAGATGGGTFSGRFLTYSARGPAGCDESAIKGFVSGQLVGTVHL
jgi:hypothetical protein